MGNAIRPSPRENRRAERGLGRGTYNGTPQPGKRDCRETTPLSAVNTKRCYNFDYPLKTALDVESTLWTHTKEAKMMLVCAIIYSQCTLHRSVCKYIITKFLHSNLINKLTLFSWNKKTDRLKHFQTVHANQNPPNAFFLSINTVYIHLKNSACLKKPIR